MAKKGGNKCLNKVELIGNLGADPESRGSEGSFVCNIRLATNETWTDKEGTLQERTEWHRVAVWGKLGEVCDQYLSKGRRIFVEGRLQTRSYVDKDDIKRYSTEIVAYNVIFLDGASEEAERDRDAGNGGRRSSNRGNDDRYDDEF